MSNQEILEKAIEKAMAGGWDWENLPADDWSELSELEKQHVIHVFSKMPREIIFNHDFAKALWGDEPVLFIEGTPQDKLFDDEVADYADRPWNSVEGYMRTFEWHLQQMVIAEDPIAYLGENI